MAKKFSFSILGDIANASDIAEVGYNYSFKGKTLQQGSVGADGSFTINFANKKKSVKGVIEFEKLNATGSGNFTNNSVEYSLASDEFSIFKANAKKSPQVFTYSFSLDNPVTPNPPNPEANRIALSTFQDIYSNTQGGQVIGGTFTPNNERFTQGQDIVTATVGTLGQEDSLIDSQQG
ncbi:MAG: hypothetical protein ACO3FN_01995, partial [Vulcanococcus sp.]